MSTLSAANNLIISYLNADSHINWTKKDYQDSNNVINDTAYVIIYFASNYNGFSVLLDSTFSRKFINVHN